MVNNDTARNQIFGHVYLKRPIILEFTIYTRYIVSVDLNRGISHSNFNNFTERVVENSRAHLVIKRNVNVSSKFF